MNNEQKIIDAIIAEAKQDAANITQRARDDAEQAIAAAQVSISEQNAPVLEKARASADELSSKSISSAKTEAGKSILAAKQQILENAVSGAKAKLLGLTGKEYEDILMKMADSVGDPSGCVVILSQNDKENYGQLFTQKGFGVSEKTRQLSSGFIVQKDAVEYNFTFESIFTASKDVIDEIAAGILFA